MGEISADVISQAKIGDRRALETLLRAISGFVAGMLGKLVGPIHELEDLHQAVLMKIATHVSMFRGESSIQTWVGSLCVQTAGEHFRSAKKLARNKAQSSAVSEVTERMSASLERRIEARERWAKLERALDHLSPNHRTAVLLKNVMGYSVEEIAQLMGSASSTTRLRLYYGRKALAKAIERVLDDKEEEA